MSNQVKPQVRKSDFIKLVETNTKAQVAAHYGLTEKDVTKIAGQLKVKFSKRKEDNFVIIDDELEDTNTQEMILQEPITEKETIIFTNTPIISESSNITNVVIPVIELL
jgi:hypothetical protein